MFKIIISALTGAVLTIGSWFGIHSTPAESVPVSTSPSPSVVVTVSPTVTPTVTPAPASGNSQTKSVSRSASTVSKNVTGVSQKILSQSDLLSLADSAYADGNVPLGDGKYVTSAPKKGYVYLCNVHKDNFGAYAVGPWINTNANTWNESSKVKVGGTVSWPNATFSNTVSGSTRTLTGNGLPVGYPTGTYPIQSTDPASAYDRNPNSVKTQSLSVKLPANPVYSDTPYCMFGEVGIMTNGVPLFDGFDADLRDAPAHELQDLCDGHPQESGEYHYHSLSSCFKDIHVETVLGFAYDGFPITGPVVGNGKYLTTNDLDECHGITSEVMLDGKKTITYHYVMTKDFPYSASCFRGKPAVTGPSVQAQFQGPPQGGPGMGMPPPPGMMQY